MRQVKELAGLCNDYKGSVKCDGNDFSSTVRALQSGELISLYAISDGKWPSANTNAYVSFPGKGTESDPYLVYTAADLQGVYKRGYYKMMNDIDLAEWINANSPSEGWQSIGKGGVSDIYFNGDDHTVSGLWCSTDEDYNGLFSNFPGGCIRNLTVKTAEGKSVKGGNYSVILIGRMINGTIKNVTVEGKVESSSANAKIGGLAGEADGGSITRCYSNVNIEASGDSIVGGALLGAGSSDISISYAKGQVTLAGKGSYAGGLVGQNFEDGSIADCYSEASAASTLYAA